MFPHIPNFDYLERTRICRSTGTAVCEFTTKFVPSQIVVVRSDVVALLVGHWTCDLEVTGSSPGLTPLHSGLGTSYLHLCASDTKQYYLVPAMGGDLFGWQSNRRPCGK